MKLDELNSKMQDLINKEKIRIDIKGDSGEWTVDIHEKKWYDGGESKFGHFLYTRIGYKKVRMFTEVYDFIMQIIKEIP